MTDPLHIVSYLPGTPESAMPSAFVATLGDHVWARLDADGRPDLRPVGGLDQLLATATRHSTVDAPIPGGTPFDEAVWLAAAPEVEILNVVDMPEPAPEAAQVVEAGPEVETEETLATLSKDALKALCDTRGLSHVGTVDELIARLIDGE